MGAKTVRTIQWYGVGGMIDAMFACEGCGWVEPRLHIPAGILRIPVFSVPITCFSQESQFLFRSNLVYRNKKEQKPSQ